MLWSGIAHSSHNRCTLSVQNFSGAERGVGINRARYPKSTAVACGYQATRLSSAPELPSRQNRIGAFCYANVPAASQRGVGARHALHRQSFELQMQQQAHLQPGRLPLYRSQVSCKCSSDAGGADEYAAGLPASLQQLANKEATEAVPASEIDVPPSAAAAIERTPTANQEQRQQSTVQQKQTQQGTCQQEQKQLLDTNQEKQHQEQDIPKHLGQREPLQLLDWSSTTVQQPDGPQLAPPQLRLTAQPVHGQFREKLRQLLQQQQGQHQGPTSSADLRAAATGSTDLLLSLLISQLPWLVGSRLGGGSSNSTACTVDGVSAASEPTPSQQRALLREALVSVAWHCRTHRLLPAEAQRLQEVLLQQLLPALRPYLCSTNTKVLARIVFALGSCWANCWQQQHQYSSSRLQQQELISSADWVMLLLPLLPPSQLSAGALLATLEGCALHEVKPPPHWLAQASLAAYSMLEHNKFDFNDGAALLQAFSQLEYFPPPWLMRTLVRRMQQWIPFLNPADLSGVLSSLQELGFRPGNTWIRVWCESSSRLLRGMTIGQLAAAAGALSWAGYNPKAWWGAKLFAASSPLLPVATADELLLLLDAVLGLRLTAPLGWVHSAYCQLRSMKQDLTPSQVADAAHVLASLQLPGSMFRHHRVWLAGCLKTSQVQDVASLKRSELLYLLYAAGKLRVNPGGAWLAAALRQLHQQLEGASPAELVGSFMVFVGFRQQLSLHQARVEVALWLRDCLAAVVGCVQQFSNEGLLQLLLACADAGIGSPQQQQQQQQQHATLIPQQRHQEVPVQGQQEALISSQQQQWQQEGLAETQVFVRVLADNLVNRLPSMGLLQLSRVCKTLEGKVVNSSSSSSRGREGGKNRLPDWFTLLVQECKAAMAARA